MNMEACFKFFPGDSSSSARKRNGKRPKSLRRGGNPDELAQEPGELFLLPFVQRGEKLRDALFEHRNRVAIDFQAFVGEHDTHPAPVVGVALAYDELFLLEAVDDAGQIADSDHHLLADLAEREAAGVADRREHVELRRGQVETLEIALEFFFRNEIEAEKTHPQAGRVPGEKGMRINRHAKKSRLRGHKKQD